MGNEGSQPMDPNDPNAAKPENPSPKSKSAASSTASTPNSDAVSIASEISRASTRRGRSASASPSRGSPVVMVPSPTKPPEVDLSHLTEEERKQIADVLARAKELENKEEVRTRELADDLDNYANKIDNKRRSSMQHASLQSQLCPICHQMELNEKGDGTREGQNVCVDCERFVCINCGEFDASLSTQIKMFVCIMCQKRRQLVLSTGMWYHGSRSSLSMSIENVEKAIAVPGKPVVRRGPFERAASLSRYENYKEYEKKMADNRDRQESPHGKDDMSVSDRYSQEVEKLISRHSPEDTSPDGQLTGAKKKFRPQTLTLQNEKHDHAGGGHVSHMRRTFELHDIHAHDMNYQRHGRHHDHDHQRGFHHALDKQLKTVHHESSHNSGISPPRSPKVTRYKESPPRSPKFMDPHSGYVFSPPRSPKDSHFPTTYTDKSPPSRPPSREDLYGDSCSPMDGSKLVIQSPEDYNDNRAMPYMDDHGTHARGSKSAHTSYADSVDLASYAKAIASNTEHLTNLSSSPTRPADTKSMNRSQRDVERGDYYDEVELPNPGDKDIDYQGTDRQHVKPPIAETWSPVTDLSPIIDVSPTLEMEAEADMRKQQEQMLIAQRSLGKQLCEGLSKLEKEQRSKAREMSEYDDSMSRLKRYGKITDMNKIDQSSLPSQQPPRQVIDGRDVIQRGNSNVSTGNRQQHEQTVKKLDSAQKSMKNELEIQNKLSNRPDVPPKPKQFSGKSTTVQKTSESTQTTANMADSSQQKPHRKLPQPEDAMKKPGAQQKATQVKGNAKPDVPPKPNASGKVDATRGQKPSTYANGKIIQSSERTRQQPDNTQRSDGPPVKSKKPPAPQPPTNAGRRQPDGGPNSPPKVAPKPNMKPPSEQSRPTPAPRGVAPKPAARQMTANIVNKTQPQQTPEKRSVTTSTDANVRMRRPADGTTGAREDPSRKPRRKLPLPPDQAQGSPVRQTDRTDSPRRDPNMPDYNRGHREQGRGSPRVDGQSRGQPCPGAQPHENRTGSRSSPHDQATRSTAGPRNREMRQSPRTVAEAGRTGDRRSPQPQREHKVVDARITRVNGANGTQGDRGSPKHEEDMKRVRGTDRGSPHQAESDNRRRVTGDSQGQRQDMERRYSGERQHSGVSRSSQEGNGNRYDKDLEGSKQRSKDCDSSREQSIIDSMKNSKNLGQKIMESSVSSVSETDEEIVEIKLDDQSKPHIRRIPVRGSEKRGQDRKIQTVNIHGIQVPIRIKEQNQKLHQELRLATYSRRRQLDELEEIKYLEKQLEGIRQLENQQREVMRKRMEIAKELSTIDQRKITMEQERRATSKPIDISPPQGASNVIRRESREMSPMGTRGDQLSPMRSPQASPRRSRPIPRQNTPDSRFSPIKEDKDIEAEIQAKLDELERMECESRIQSMPLYTSDYRLGFSRGIEDRLSRSAMSPTSSPRGSYRDSKYSPKKMLSSSPGSNIQQIDFTLHPKLSRSSEYLTSGRAPTRGSRLSSSFSDVSISRRTPMRTYSLNAHDEGRIREQRKVQLQLEIDKRKRQIEDNARLREELVHAMGSSDIDPEYLSEVKARYQEHMCRSRDTVDSWEGSGIIRPLDDRDTAVEKGLDSLSRDMVFWRRSGGGALYDQDNYSSSEYIAHRSDRGSCSDVTDDFRMMSPREQYMRSHSTGGHPYPFSESKDSGMSSSTLMSDPHGLHPDYEMPAPFEGFSDYSPIMTDNECYSPHGDQRPRSMIGHVMRRQHSDQRNRPISEDYDHMLQFQGDLVNASSDTSFGDPDERIMDRMTEGGVTILHTQKKKTSTTTPTKPVKKYQFPSKRILLTQDPKDKSVKGNGIGMKIVGGKYVPGTEDEIGAYVAMIYRGGVADKLNGEIQEGDQVLEWNGVCLTGKSYEDVQKILEQRCGEVELVIRTGANMGSKYSSTVSSASTPQATTDPTTSMRSSYDNLDTSVSDYDDCVAQSISDRVLESMGMQSRFDPNTLANQLQGIQNNHSSSTAHSSHSDIFQKTNLSSLKANSSTSTSSFEKKVDFEEYFDRKPTRNYGEIELQLSFDSYDHTLNVHVLQAYNLIPKDSNGLSDPFVKVCILPPKENDIKHRTKHIDKTLNPIWHQTLIFMNVPKKHLRKRLLQVSVWDYDRFSRDDFMGELLVPLDERTLDNKPRWYKLCDKSFIEDKLGMAPEISSSSAEPAQRQRGRSPGGSQDNLSPGSDGRRGSKSKNRDKSRERSSSRDNKSRERSSSRDRVSNGSTETSPVKKPVKTMFRWMLYNVADEHL